MVVRERRTRLVEEAPPGEQVTYPHVYGAIGSHAVVHALPLDVAERCRRESFGSIFLQEMFVNAGLGLVLMLADLFMPAERRKYLGYAAIAALARHGG